MRNPFVIFTASVFLALILPALLQDGMFMDGQQYACVAKNLANGQGSFWFPHLSDTWSRAGSPHFMEHPPLIYAIQAGFFKVLGDSMYTERIYSLLMALLTAWLIAACWRLFANRRELSWLPVLLWIIVPVGFWAFHHNMHENTMGVFTLGAVYCALRAVAYRRQTIVWLLFSGLLIFAATLSKGVPGLFPLATVGIYWLAGFAMGDSVDPRFRRLKFSETIGFSFVLLAASALPYLLLSTNAAAVKSLGFYINERLLARIEGDPTVGNRFYILERLLGELIPSALVVLVGWLAAKSLSRRFDLQIDRVHLGQAILWFGLGMAGTLPLMLTTVQRGFYFTPALPFFGLAFAVIAAPALAPLVKNISAKTSTVLHRISLLLLAAVIVFSFLQIGSAKRDADILADVYSYGELMEKGSTLGIEQSMYDHWSLIFYMLRYYDISCLPTNNLSGEKAPAFFLDDPKTAFTPSANYHKIDSGSETNSSGETHSGSEVDDKSGGKRYNLFALTK